MPLMLRGARTIPERKGRAQMERYYRILLLFTLIGVAVGITGLVLDQRVLALIGCLLIPAGAYAVAVLIDLFRRIGR